MAGAFGNSVANMLSNCQTLFQSGCTILKSHLQWMRVLISLCLQQHLLSFFFLIITILVGEMGYQTLVFWGGFVCFGVCLFLIEV